MDLDSAYLAVSAAVALNTANALKPVNRTGRASALSFFPGWLTSEFPLHALALQLSATATLAATTDTFSSRKGKAGLLLSAASWAGLVALYRSSTTADSVLDAALVEAFGDGYRERVSGDFAPPEGVPLTSKQIANAFPRVRRTFVAHPDVPYGAHGRRNLLDIWKRADLPATARAPILVHVHGGAWVIGNKEQQGNPLMAHLAERGYLCVAVNYRLSPRSTWPDHIIDIKRALAWVKANIAHYGGDANFVAITGGSAGGHLASLAALTPCEPSYQPGFEEADTSVQAAVPLYGVYDLANHDGTGHLGLESFLEQVVLKVPKAAQPELWDQASPIARVHPDAPPFFVLHGTNDSLAPVEQARSFVQALRQHSSSPVAYAELPQTQHAFDVLSSIRTLHTVRAIDRFLALIRTERQTPDKHRVRT